MKTHHFNFYGIFLIVLLCACSKMVDIETPKNQLTTDKIFKDSTSVKAALYNVYVSLEKTHYPASNKYLSNYTDELLSTANPDWNNSRLSALTGTHNSNWAALYNAIYQCNMLLEELPKTVFQPAFVKQITAEALFLRAYCNFYLVNLFGFVPLLTATNVNENSIAKQSDSTRVYQHLLKDLLLAKELMSSTNNTKIRVGKDAIIAFLAKIHLYQRNWLSAEQLSNDLINSGKYTPLVVPELAFKANSKESILQFASQNGFVAEATAIIPANSTTIPPYHFTAGFYNSFEQGDLRRANWMAMNTVTLGGLSTSYYYPFKYKNRTLNTSTPEDLIVFRIAEQYLIRAEARAQLGRLTGAASALEDLHVIRQRAGLIPLNLINKQQILDAIYEERRHEMFFENADRFMDLKRSGRLNDVMQKDKPTWIKSSSLLPIPTASINANPNLKQNEGY